MKFVKKYRSAIKTAASSEVFNRVVDAYRRKWVDIDATDQARHYSEQFNHTPLQRLILAYVMGCVKKFDGLFYQSHSTIAEALKCSRQSVITALNLFRAQGMLDWVQQFRRTAEGIRQTVNRYCVKFLDTKTPEEPEQQYVTIEQIKNQPSLIKSNHPAAGFEFGYWLMRCLESQSDTRRPLRWWQNGFNGWVKQSYYGGPPLPMPT